MTKRLDPDFPVFEVKGSDGAYLLLCEMLPSTDTAGREYEMVTQCLEDDDLYQVAHMITVIKRKSDSRLFGYSWYQAVDKHGEDYMESNGDEYGLEFEGDTDAEDFDWDNDYPSYFVFVPVVENHIVSYRKA